MPGRATGPARTVVHAEPVLPLVGRDGRPRAGAVRRSVAIDGVLDLVPRGVDGAFHILLEGLGLVLDLAADPVRFAFVLEALVTGEVAGSFLHSALDLIRGSTH